MGITSGQGSIRYVPNISGDFGRDWGRAHSLAAGARSPCSLSNEFEPHFPSSKVPRRTNEWIRNLFVNVPNHLSVQEEDQLIEIANDGGRKSVFEQTSLAGFWIKTKADYPEISVKALITLLPFPTTYRWEAGFSAMTATKTKFCNRLDITNTVFHHPQMEPSCCRETSTGLPLIKMNCSLFCGLTNAPNWHIVHVYTW